MKKIKIFYSDRSATLSNGLDYLQGKVNTWVNESGAEIGDVKMNISNHNNPVITVIYEENVPAVTSEKSQLTPTHEDMCGGWRAADTVGSHNPLSYIQRRAGRLPMKLSRKPALRLRKNGTIWHAEKERRFRSQVIVSIMLS